MTKVPVRDGKLEAALKVWKNKVAKTGNLKKAREIQEGYKKRGVRKREQEKEQKKNSRRKAKRERSYN
jgi:ribosomal protein S21